MATIGLPSDHFNDAAPPDAIINNEVDNLRLGLRAGVASMQGRRREMQDAHVIHYEPGSLRGCAVFGVFDGHGGTFASSWTAKHLVPRLEQCLRDALPDHGVLDTALLRRTIKEAFLQTDMELAQASDADSGHNSKSKSGCTAHV